MKRLLLIALLMVFFSQEARAQEAFEIGPAPAHYLLFGPSGGASFSLPGGGGFVGGELSYSRLRRGLWMGLYTDLAYDFGRSHALFTAGPQIGRQLVGVDGGVALQDFQDVGAAARLVVTTGAFGIFGRYVYVADGHQIQVGAMLKFPAGVW